MLDVELNGPRQTVRIVIDTPTGVTLDTCTDVTHLVRPLIDHAIEVSSPGAERPLRYERHFRDALGATVRVRVEGHHKAFQAEISQVTATEVTLRLPDDTDKTVPFDHITRAHLVEQQTDAAGATKGRP